MKILLTGSSGFIGRHITGALTAAGHTVIAASRQNGIDFSKIQDISDWLPHLESVEVVINCVGIIVESRSQYFQDLHTRAPSALFRACEQAGVSRVIQISALGADEQAFTAYQKTKKAADDVLRELNLDWFILRPSLVYGQDGTSTKFFQRLASLPVLPLLEGGKQQIQPVHIQDLVDVVLACLVTSDTKQTIDVVGPQAMTFRQWIERLQKISGKRSSIILPVTFQVMLLMSLLLRYLMPLFHPDNLRMLQKNNIADVDGIKKLLGRVPRDVP